VTSILVIFSGELEGPRTYNHNNIKLFMNHYEPTAAIQDITNFEIDLYVFLRSPLCIIQQKNH